MPDSEPSPTPVEDPSARLAERLRALAPGPLEVRLGRARRHPVQLEQSWDPVHGRRRRLRLHSVFAGAPDEVLAALAAWLRSGRRARRACAELDAWIASAVPAVERRRPRATRTLGTHRDLGPVLQSVLEDPTASALRALDPVPPVGWGRWPTRPPRRRIQLGAFDTQAGVVRVHPVLDDPSVPEPCLRYVVFHELLHAALELPEGEGPHGPTFRREERVYRHTAEAEAWIARTSSALVERVARVVRRNRRAR